MIANLVIFISNFDKTWTWCSVTRARDGNRRGPTLTSISVHQPIKDFFLAQSTFWTNIQVFNPWPFKGRLQLLYLNWTWLMDFFCSNPRIDSPHVYSPKYQFCFKGTSSTWWPMNDWYKSVQFHFLQGDPKTMQFRCNRVDVWQQQTRVKKRFWPWKP